MPSRDDWITLITLLDRKTQEGSIRWTAAPNRSAGLVPAPVINTFSSEFNGARYTIYEFDRGRGLGALAGSLGTLVAGHIRLVVQQTPDGPEIAAPEVPGLEQLFSSVTRQVVDLSRLIENLRS